MLSSYRLYVVNGIFVSVSRVPPYFTKHINRVAHEASHYVDVIVNIYN